MFFSGCTLTPKPRSPEELKEEKAAESHGSTVRRLRLSELVRGDFLGFIDIEVYQGWRSTFLDPGTQQLGIRRSQSFCVPVCRSQSENSYGLYRGRIAGPTTAASSRGYVGHRPTCCRLGPNSFTRASAKTGDTWVIWSMDIGFRVIVFMV